MIRVKCALLILLAIAVASLAVAGKADDPAPPAKDKPVRSAADLRDKLAQPIRFTGIDDPKMSLHEALAFLADRHDLKFDIDEAALKAEQLDDVSNLMIAERPLPKMDKVSLETVLRRILARVPAESGMTFLVLPDRIEITTVRKASPGMWNEIERKLVPVVNTVFDKLPLTVAMEDLSEATGISILVDPKTSDKGKMLLSANLKNVPLDTAVKLLADMAGLEAIAIDNVIYVTTEQNARVWENRIIPR